MGGLRQIGEPKRSGTALNGMRSAENGIQLLRIRMLDIQIEQQTLHRCQVFRRLIEKHLVELTHVDRHAIPPSSAALESMAENGMWTICQGQTRSH